MQSNTAKRSGGEDLDQVAAETGEKQTALWVCGSSCGRGDVTPPYDLLPEPRGEDVARNRRKTVLPGPSCEKAQI
ncbi:hypothetical protein SKAU_G00147730 [Synaphobranchus kaupii]|uniref:Uncharacterized protein n=1 Tax=Synaphobranchus kaupii TaxID=118154 RepID=A0A9Q1J2Q9_SYNKA|nr:hypothetical protein SKAU_G00147730 [Synaphobranchus kaupii]